VTNIVLCFDRAGERAGPGDATNAQALLRLLDDAAGQLVWYHSGSANRSRRRERVIAEARAAIAEAYRLLVDRWQPGDAIFLFGVGRGAYCARALARLLGLVGVLPDRTDFLPDYALATYALPATPRTTQDWQRVARLAQMLVGSRELAVPVRFLGLWDMTKLPGLPRPTTPLANVVAGRHAVAIDGGPSGERLSPGDLDRIDEVWFRGAHCDIAGTPGACWPLADIALDWMLAGAAAAGVALRGSSSAPAPSELGALAGSARTLPLRRPPLDARVHASVDLYLRAHPQYWRRLPARVVWADRDWLARGERLVPAAAPAPARVLQAAS
jgi:Uncharacterized alpha/beta hydrolase domain (DUF2235)